MVNGDHDIWIDISLLNSKINRLTWRVFISPPPPSPLVNVHHDIWIYFSLFFGEAAWTKTSRNPTFEMISSHLCDWGLCLFFHFLSHPPLINGHYDFCMVLNLATPKNVYFLGRMWYTYVCFSIMLFPPANLPIFCLEHYTSPFFAPPLFPGTINFHCPHHILSQSHWFDS